jgi:hypothetical protein
MSFFFVTGDEHYFDEPQSALYQKFLGTPVENSISGKKEWKRLMENYNVFHVKKAYGGHSEQEIYKQWCETLGEERVLRIETPKACIDVILGAIALASGTKNLQSYIVDMQDRGQTEERIVEVSNALTK